MQAQKAKGNQTSAWLGIFANVLVGNPGPVMISSPNNHPYATKHSIDLLKNISLLSMA